MIATGGVITEVDGYRIHRFDVAGVPSRASWGLAAWASGGGALASAVDGNNTTRWSSGTPIVPGTSYFRVDLGRAVAINGGTLNASVFSGDVPSAGRFQSSDDGATWTTRATWVVGNIAGGVLTLACPETTARYWRWIADGTANGGSSNWWSIGEVTLTGPAVTAALSVTVPGDCEVQAIGGGGAGGGIAGTGVCGGGGGGGGVSARVPLTLGIGTYRVVVGDGGAPATGRGTSGGDTAMYDTDDVTTLVSAIGGGAGGSLQATPPLAGGSGGGGSASGSWSTNGAAGTAGQGNAGGNGHPSGHAGGGGGAGAAGGNADGASGGAGGAGVATTIMGASQYVGAGGGGGATSGAAGPGGQGGGGAGGATGAPGVATGIGAGGGGTGWNTAGGAGIAGALIVRYAIGLPPDAPTITISGVTTTGAHLAGSAYFSPEGAPQQAARWQVTLASDPTFSAPVVDTGWTGAYLSAFDVAGLADGIPYLARAAYSDETGAQSDFGAASAFTTVPYVWHPCGPRPISAWDACAESSLASFAIDATGGVIADVRAGAVLPDGTVAAIATRIHRFPTGGPVPFTISAVRASAPVMTVLLVGGGGGGESSFDQTPAGAGGGGGVQVTTVAPVVGSTNVIVGAGGTGGDSGGVANVGGGDGGATSFGAVSVAGGRGGGGATSGHGGSGGSGAPTDHAAGLPLGQGIGASLAGGAGGGGGAGGVGGNAVNYGNPDIGARTRSGDGGPPLLGMGGGGAGGTYQADTGLAVQGNRQPGYGAGGSGGALINTPGGDGEDGTLAVWYPATTSWSPGPDAPATVWGACHA